MMDEGASSPGSPGTAESTARQYKMISIGICAMNKKTLAPPMQNILYRLKQQDYVRFIYFTDEMILNDPIVEWPTCDCVIAFYSKGFPLEKAINYVKLRNPFVINDLQMQYALQDRRQVYEILAQNGIEVPRYMILNRPEKTSSSPSDEELIEADDQVEIGGQVFHKPFVEKPISAEDHNIYIYFPSDYGGGSQRLFRKVKDRSSEYSKESSVRKKGSYIYEEFMATDGTDVKVYTVGPDYAHAEARKSPALDGKVERDEQGKEKRFPVILTAKEKLIARQVCLAFKQTVCGFDLLRANGKSYVCDVNGFSFVKNSQKYYEDCAQILLEMITEQFAPEYFPLIPPSVEYLAEEVPVPIPKTGNQLELRCVIGVIRHGDRTPKQKMKMIVKHKKFFDLFADLNGYKTGHLKIKKPKQLQKVLDIARYLLDNVEKYHESHEIGEKVHKLQQLKSVLEMYGYFSGINRKVQFKLLKEAKGGPLLLLILKWGGELTPAGQRQAEELGRAFRCMYPGGQGEYASLPGSGFLRLHSTYRHDLKVYASDEGRVQMTAAAFTKGLLDLEGNLASVLVHLVKRDQNATNMLDTSTGAQDALLKVKMRLHEFLRSHEVVTEQQALENLAPTMVESIVSALKHIKNPREACEQLYQSVQALTKEIKKIVASGAEVELYHEETPQMMHNRWAKLEKDFKMKDGRFDISKIPDIYDCIKYDLVHNRHLGLKKALQTFQQAMHLADVVIPQEYGITVAEKMDIATKICSPLLRKIQADLHHTIMEEHSDIIHRLDAKLSRGVITPNRHVRSRLYFTSESHIHSMLNILRYGGLVENPEDPSWRHTMEKVGRFSELNYMTQIVIMLFEDDSKPYDSDTRYRVDVHFSPGVKGSEEMAKWSCKEHPTPTLKLSPDMVSKSSSMWVKRLIVDDGVPRQLGTEPIHIHVPHHYLPKSSSAVTRKASEPATYNLKSASEGQLTRRPRGFPLTLATGGCDQVTDGLQSSSTSILDLGEGTGILEETPSEKTILGDERQDVSLSPTKTEQKKLHLKSGVSAFAEDSQHSLVEGGLELAAELSSTLEPLILLCSTPLLKMNTFLTQQTGVTLDY